MKISGRERRLHGDAVHADQPRRLSGSTVPESDVVPSLVLVSIRIESVVPARGAFSLTPKPALLGHLRELIRLTRSRQEAIQHPARAALRIRLVLVSPNSPE
jgi:hypothetical protein